MTVQERLDYLLKDCELKSRFAKDQTKWQNETGTNWNDELIDASRAYSDSQLLLRDFRDAIAKLNLDPHDQCPPHLAHKTID